MVYTLIVMIFTQDGPSSAFHVEYPTQGACQEGYKTAHQMSIDPKTQIVRALCGEGTYKQILAKSTQAASKK